MSERYSETDRKRYIAIDILERTIKSDRYDDGYNHIINNLTIALRNAKDEDIDTLMNTPPISAILNSYLGLQVYGPHMLVKEKPPVEENPKTDSCCVATNKKNRRIVLKIVLLSLLISVCVFCFVIGCFWLNEFLYYMDIELLLAGLVWTVPSIIVAILSIRSIRSMQPQAKQKISINQKEKCYKRIDKIHKYYERGSITKEEFESLKKEILSEIVE